MGQLLIFPLIVTVIAVLAVSLIRTARARNAGASKVECVSFTRH